jgi:RNA polymerase sigma-32 factor
MSRRWVGATSAKKRSKSVSASRSSSPKRERELIERWTQGDRWAGEELVKNFLPFVVSIAVEYRRWGVPLDDVIQQGCLGLLRAAQRFEPEQNVRLVTYAAYWIRAEIRDYVLRSYRMVRLGTTKSERKALRTYRVTHESDPEKLAKASGLSVERAERLLPLLSARDASLDQGLEGSIPFHDKLADAGPSPEDAAIRALDGIRLRNTILEVLSELSVREQLIAHERWLKETPTTLEALGSRLGVTKERVRQIEDRTRQKVRARLEKLKVA